MARRVINVHQGPVAGRGARRGQTQVRRVDPTVADAQKTKFLADLQTKESASQRAHESNLATGRQNTALIGEAIRGRATPEGLSKFRSVLSRSGGGAGGEKPLVGDQKKQAEGQVLAFGKFVTPQEKARLSRNQARGRIERRGPIRGVTELPAGNFGQEGAKIIRDAGLAGLPADSRFDRPAERQVRINAMAALKKQRAQTEPTPSFRPTLQSPLGTRTEAGETREAFLTGRGFSQQEITTGQVDPVAQARRAATREARAALPQEAAIDARQAAELAEFDARPLPAFDALGAATGDPALAAARDNARRIFGENDQAIRDVQGDLSIPDPADPLGQQTNAFLPIPGQTTGVDGGAPAVLPAPFPSPAVQPPTLTDDPALEADSRARIARLQEAVRTGQPVSNLDLGQFRPPTPTTSPQPAPLPAAPAVDPLRQRLSSTGQPLNAQGLTAADEATLRDIATRRVIRPGEFSGGTEQLAGLDDPTRAAFAAGELRRPLTADEQGLIRTARGNLPASITLPGGEAVTAPALSDPRAREEAAIRRAAGDLQGQGLTDAGVLSGLRGRFAQEGGPLEDVIASDAADRQARLAALEQSAQAVAGQQGFGGQDLFLPRPGEAGQAAVQAAQADLLRAKAEESRAKNDPTTPAGQVAALELKSRQLQNRLLELQGTAAEQQLGTGGGVGTGTPEQQTGAAATFVAGLAFPDLDFPSLAGSMFPGGPAQAGFVAKRSVDRAESASRELSNNITARIGAARTPNEVRAIGAAIASSPAYTQMIEGLNSMKNPSIMQQFHPFLKSERLEGIAAQLDAVKRVVENAASGIRPGGTPAPSPTIQPVQ